LAGAQHGKELAMQLEVLWEKYADEKSTLNDPAA
jgi:hypothetical protein